jgi:hypothetical protein
MDRGHIAGTAPVDNDLTLVEFGGISGALTPNSGTAECVGSAAPSANGCYWNLSEGSLLYTSVGAASEVRKSRMV